MSVLAGTGAMAAAVLLIQNQIEGAAVSLALSVLLGALVFFLTSLLMRNDMLLGAVSMIQRKNKV